MRSEHATVDGISLRWEGTGSGPPVVLIHGIPTGPALWRRVVVLITEALRLAWEMVGYGQSMREGEGRDISVARQAGYLAAWMDALGLERAVLVGHDLGGVVAQIAATTHLERCAGLVLVNSITYDSWPIPSVKAMRAAGPAVEPLPAGAFRLVFGRFLRLGHDDRAVAREPIALHWAPDADAGGPPGFVRQIVALRTQGTLAVADAKLGVPARVVWGTADRFQRIHYGERLAAPLLRLDGARHFVPEDHPEAVASAVAAVLAATLPDADDDTRSHVLAGFSELPAHPDAGPAMERLEAAGVRILCLTNGGAPATTALLERNGLDGYVERVVSVDEVRAWKPVPAPYQHAAAVAGVAPGELALIAVHAWDCHGAHRAGLVSGWASRLEGRFAPIFDPPDVAGADLVEVVDGLLALEK